MSLFLSDADLQGITHRRQPCAQARMLTRIGVPFQRRPDGTLLVSRTAFEAAMSGSTMGQKPAANGLNWSRRA